MGADGRRWPAPADPHERAQMLFQHTKVELAILETTPEELLRDGFGNDRCDVAVALTAVAPDDEMAPDPAGFLKAVRHALVSGGTFIALGQDEAAAIRAGINPDALLLVVERPDLDKKRRAIAADDAGTIWIIDQARVPRALGKCPASVAAAERPLLLAHCTLTQGTSRTRNS